MSISNPGKNWWKPLHREEKIWMYIILGWALILLMMMPLGHLVSRQNVSQETYKVTPQKFRKITDKFIEKYQKRDKNGKRVFKSGIAVVKAPAGKESYLIARQWVFEPILEFEAGKTYRVHMSSMDVQHGFSLQPENLNFQVMPDYDFVITLTPRTAGDRYIVCNEFCLAPTKTQGHDSMVGMILVKDAKVK